MSFNGEVVTITGYYPDYTPGDVFFEGHEKVRPGGTTFPTTQELSTGRFPADDIVPLSYTFRGDDITIQTPAAYAGFKFPAGSFDGTVVSIPHEDPAIRHVSVLNNSFPPADVTWTGHKIFINASGLTVPPGAPPVELSVTFVHTAALLLTHAMASMSSSGSPPLVSSGPASASPEMGTTLAAPHQH